MSEYVVENSEDCFALVKSGDRNRVVRQTKMNIKSSRSHSIFQIFIESDQADNNNLIRRAKLNLCDLAGSEKFDKTGEMNH